MYLHNLRSLEGIRVNGGAIAPGTVYRSAGPLAKDTDFLGVHEELGIRWVLDLREDAERSSTQAWPATHFNVSSVPVFENQLANTSWSELDDVYRVMVENHGHQLGKAVDFLAEASQQDGGILVHCTAGKDRTGVVIALLLALLGADKKDIVADYLKSSEMLGAGYLRDRGRLPEANRLPGAEINVMIDVRQSCLDLTEMLINQRGGIASYLADHGLGDSSAALLSQHLVR
ncbi:tyrosine-protein phosphatase [Corynebacterium sp. A21]|uniref:tyrosine-protein phosphatase n=1 Tax=Corynebacterium sp. A21 TaxID=3457318 RepID=UPI003FCEECB6